MKKVIFSIITLLMFTLTVNAGSPKYCQATTSNGSCDSSDSLNNEFFQFKSEYDKGIQTNSISSKGSIVIYGYSKCNNGSCTYSYVGGHSDYKEVLKKSVKCTGGEKYINFQQVSQVKKDQADDNYTGEMYWNEDYEITCTNTSSSNTVELSNSVNTGSSNNSNNINSGGSNNSSNEYDSADTTDPSNTGVETYYIILAVVGIITYAISVIIKKQNLFKKF